MRDWLLYAEDIFNACIDIDSYVRGMSYDTFIDDKRTRDATIHNLLIIGESVKIYLRKFWIHILKSNGVKLQV